MTTVHPAASAGPIFLAFIACGKFHGVRTALRYSLEGFLHSMSESKLPNT
jgi:hypothetical protein